MELQNIYNISWSTTSLRKKTNPIIKGKRREQTLTRETKLMIQNNDVLYKHMTLHSRYHYITLQK